MSYPQILEVVRDANDAFSERLHQQQHHTELIATLRSIRAVLRAGVVVAVAALAYAVARDAGRTPVPFTTTDTTVKESQP